MKSLRERDDIFMTATDKTKKLCINTKENYTNRMGVHLTGNEEINWAAKQDNERVLNAHAIQMIRMFKIGDNHQYRGRIKMAFHNKFGHIPVLRGVDKDHKDGFDPAVGPPLRPIVAADEAPNGQIAEIMTQIFRLTLFRPTSI